MAQALQSISWTFLSIGLVWYIAKYSHIVVFLFENNISATFYINLFKSENKGLSFRMKWNSVGFIKINLTNLHVIHTMVSRMPPVFHRRCFEPIPNETFSTSLSNYSYA